MQLYDARPLVFFRKHIQHPAILSLADDKFWGMPRAPKGTNTLAEKKIMQKFLALTWRYSTLDTFDCS